MASVPQTTLPPPTATEEREGGRLTGLMRKLSAKRGRKLSGLKPIRGKQGEGSEDGGRADSGHEERRDTGEDGSMAAGGSEDPSGSRGVGTGAGLMGKDRSVEGPRGHGTEQRPTPNRLPTRYYTPTSSPERSSSTELPTHPHLAPTPSTHVHPIHNPRSSPPSPSSTALSPNAGSTDRASDNTLIPTGLQRLYAFPPGGVPAGPDLTPRAEEPPDLERHIVAYGSDVGPLGSQSALWDKAGEMDKMWRPGVEVTGEPLAQGNVPKDVNPPSVADLQETVRSSPIRQGGRAAPDSYFPDLDTALLRVQTQTRASTVDESPTGSEGRTPGSIMPWPSSKRHGGTPIGAGLAALDASALRTAERVSEGDMLTPVSMSSAQSGALTDEELVAAGSGFMVSTPLSPPPGYPTASPIPHKVARSAPSSHENTPSLETGGHGPRHTSFGAFTGVTAAWKGAVDARRMSEASQLAGEGSAGQDEVSRSEGSPIDSRPSSVSASPTTSFGDGEFVHGHTPYEGKITIDTQELQYVITAELEGFKLENITIAVKRITVTSPNPAMTNISDSASMRSFASAQSTASVASANAMAPSSDQRASLNRSQHRTRRLADDPYAIHGAVGGDVDDSDIPHDLAARRTSSASMSSTGSLTKSHSGLGMDQSRENHPTRRKVVHLVADRWEDSAHFERRITFGADADLSGGIKAKFDGRLLIIVVPRQPRTHSHNTLRKKSSADTTPATTSVSAHLEPTSLASLHPSSIGLAPLATTAFAAAPFHGEVKRETTMHPPKSAGHAQVLNRDGMKAMDEHRSRQDTGATLPEGYEKVDGFGAEQTLLVGFPKTDSRERSNTV